MRIEICGPESANVPYCEHVLRSLPDWFGIEDAIVEYLNDIKTMSTFHAWVNSNMVGFLSIQRHTTVSAEIHVMGVLPHMHAKGIGSALIQTAQTYLKRGGVKILEVKTLGASHPDKIFYEQTRHFYQSVGFLPLEEIEDFWGPGLPTLFLVKCLSEDCLHS